MSYAQDFLATSFKCAEDMTVIAFAVLAISIWFPKLTQPDTDVSTPIIVCTVFIRYRHYGIVWLGTPTELRLKIWDTCRFRRNRSAADF